MLCTTRNRSQGLGNVCSVKNNLSVTLSQNCIRTGLICFHSSIIYTSFLQIKNVQALVAFFIYFPQIILSYLFLWGLLSVEFHYAFITDLRYRTADLSSCFLYTHYMEKDTLFLTVRYIKQGKKSYNNVKEKTHINYSAM